MMDEQLEELASLYVLDCLDGEELRNFEARLTSDADLRRYVDDLRETTAQLAYAAPARALPPELEARILAQVRSIGAPARSAARGLSWLPWAIAACLALACVLLAADRTRMSREVEHLQRRDVFSQMRIASLSSKLESAPRATAVVVWDSEKQEGVLKVSDVPLTGSNRDYQLWMVDPQYGQPVDAGVFNVDNGGTTKISFKPKARIISVDAFAVTLERKGGVPKAEGPTVLVGK